MTPSRWFKFNLIDETILLANMDNVETIQPLDKGGCLVSFISGETATVNNSLEEILETMERARE